MRKLVFAILLGIGDFGWAQVAQQLEVRRSGSNEGYLYRWTDKEERLYTTSNALGGGNAIGLFKRPTQGPMPKFLTLGAATAPLKRPLDGYLMFIGSSPVDPSSSLGREIERFLSETLKSPTWRHVRGSRIERVGSKTLLVTIDNGKIKGRKSLDLAKFCVRPKAVVAETRCLIEDGQLILR